MADLRAIVWIDRAWPSIEDLRPSENGTYSRWLTHGRFRRRWPLCATTFTLQVASPCDESPDTFFNIEITYERICRFLVRE